MFPSVCQLARVSGLYIVDTTDNWLCAIQKVHSTRLCTGCWDGRGAGWSDGGKTIATATAAAPLRRQHRPPQIQQQPFAVAAVVTIYSYHCRRSRLRRRHRAHHVRASRRHHRSTVATVNNRGVKKRPHVKSVPRDGKRDVHTNVFMNFTRCRRSHYW